jgi:hypothetical protein
MSSLLDRINQNMPKQTTATGPQIGQEQVAGVLKAKSGKAAAPGMGAAPQASNLLVDTAKQQATDKLKQIGLVGDIAKQGLQAGFQQQQQQLNLGKQQLATQKEMTLSGLQASEQQAAMARTAREEEARTKRSAEENMKMDVMQSQASTRIREATAQREVALDDLFADFEMSKVDLADRKDAARLHQLGLDLAFSDRVYLDTIDRIGRERMLNNDLQFREESARILLGHNLDMLREDMKWGRSFNAKRRVWERELVEMGLDDALAIARAEIREGNSRAVAEGIGNILSWASADYEEPKQSNAGHMWESLTKDDTTPTEGST